MLKLAAVILGWLVSLFCLAVALYTVGSLALEPAARRDIHGLSYAVACITVPFYGALGVTLNPLVFPRLAKAIWLRFLIAAVTTTVATFAGWLVYTLVLTPPAI